MFKKIKGKLKKKKGGKTEKNTSAKPAAKSTQASKTTAKSVSKESTSKYDESIIQQLIKFGYQRTEILSAMKTVTNKKDINEIQAAIDASADQSVNEMKYDEAAPKLVENIGISDITKKCKMVYDSGTYSGYPFTNAYTPDTSYWCSKDTSKVWIVFDATKGSKIYALIMKYGASYNATSMHISTADAFDAEEWKLVKKVDTKEPEKRHAIAFGKSPNHKQFIKIEFVGNASYIGICECEVYGALASNDQATAAVTAPKAPATYKDITAAIPCVGNSKTYDGYPLSHMYTTNTSNYWCSADANNVYLIFDTGATKISQWQMTMSYTCAKVTFVTSDNKNAKDWTKITAGAPDTVININKKNKRYIKLEFSQVSSGYIGISKLQIKIPMNDKSPEGLEDEKKEEVELSQDSKDITKSLFITAVDDSGTYSGYDIKQAFMDNESYWCSAAAGDQFVVFDVNVCRIDVLEVLQNASYNTKNVSIWTTDTVSDDGKYSKWSKVASAISTAGVKCSLKINGNNQRFIKLLLEKTTSYGSLQRLKWFGSIAGDTDVTSSLSILKTSSFKTGNESENIFKDADDSYWSPQNNANEYITFDCNGKEVEKIYIAFNTDKKCKAVSLIFAEISNDYAFKEIIKTFKFSDKSKTVEELDIKSLGAYDNGYKQYIQLKFAQPFSSEIGIEQIKMLGKQTTDKNFEEEEKVDTIVENEAETTSRNKVVCLENSGTYAGETYALNNVYLDNGNYWCSSTAADVWMIFDCTQYLVNKISIKVNQSYKCVYCIIFTADKKAGRTSAAWKQIGSITEMDQGIGAKSCRIQGKSKQFIKIEFYEIMNSYLGIDRMRFIGKDLDEEYNITLDELMSGNKDDDIDVELVSKYLKTITKQRNQNLTAGYAQLAEIEEDKKRGPLTKAWMDKKREMLLMPYTFIYNQQIAESLLMQTSYEQQEAAKLARAALKKGEEEIKPKLDEEIARWKPIMAKRENMISMEREYLVAFKKQNIKKGEKVRAEYLKIEKDYKYQLSSYGSQASASGASANADAIKQAQEQMDAYASSAVNNRNDAIFGAWCASIDSGAETLGTDYSVQQYIEVIKWAHIHKTHETEERVKKLASLLDDALINKKQTMHKFHLFQLSAIYSWARAKGTQVNLDRDPNEKPTIWLLFDCKTTKINKIQLKFNETYKSAKIDIYHSNEYDEKYDVDESASKRFEKFKLLQSKKNTKQEVEIVVKNANNRYLRIEFNELTYAGYIGLERLKFYVESTDGNEIDEDTIKSGGDSPKLKIIANAKTYPGNSYKIEYVYQYADNYYWCTADAKSMWLIVDASTYKMEHVAFKFSASYATKKVIVSTSDDKDSNNWQELRTNNALNAAKENLISIAGKNKKYIKLEFLNAQSGYLGLEELKWKLFQSLAPKPEKMKIKNRSSCFGLLDNTPSFAGGAYDVENIFREGESYWMNVDLSAINKVDEDPKHYISRKICEEVCRALNIMRSGAAIEDKYKSFIKFLLCWQNEDYYIEMLMTAKKVMNLLKKPLDVEYQRLTSINSRILSLQLDEKDCIKNVNTNLELLCDLYHDWFRHKKALFWPSDLLAISKKWKQLKFKFDEKFKSILRDDPFYSETQRSLCTSDDLAMEFLNCIAINLDTSFQSKMKQLFAQNRSNLKLGAAQDDDICVHSGPVKTKSRQNIKIKLDYNQAPHPQCMAVLDIVRCAVVCQDDNELCSLYDLIVAEFSGQIKRVKNAFHPIKGRSTFGYRAVLINICYGDPDIFPYPQYRMVCEVQLLLNKYFKVRGKMHLGYGIVRSEGEKATKADEKAPHYVLAQDSCKFGKLDI